MLLLETRSLMLPLLTLFACVYSSAAGCGPCMSLRALGPDPAALPTWALTMGCVLVIGLARARVEPWSSHGYAVHARPVCVWSARVDGGVGCAEAAVGEVVGSHEGVTLGLGALHAHVPCYTRLSWPWLAVGRPWGASGERGSDRYHPVSFTWTKPDDTNRDISCLCMAVRQIDVIPA